MQAEKTEILQNFAARLKAAMARRKVTLQEVANHIGASVSTVGAWTQAKNFPQTELQPALADFLGISVQRLIHGISVTDKAELLVEEEEQAAYDSAPPRRADEATPQLCLDHLRKVLNRAQGVTGGVGYVYRMLNKHLPLDEFEQRSSALVPVTLPSQTTLLSTETGLPIPNPSRRARQA